MSGILCKLSLSCFKLFLMWLERWSAIFICGIAITACGKVWFALAAILRMLGIDVETGLFSRSLIPILRITYSGSVEGWSSRFVRSSFMCAILAPGNDSMLTWLLGDVVILDRFESPIIRIWLLVLEILQSQFLWNVFSCLFSFAVKTEGLFVRLMGFARCGLEWVWSGELCWWTGQLCCVLAGLPEVGAVGLLVI